VIDAGGSAMDLTEALRDSVADVLEKMFFIRDPEEDGLPPGSNLMTAQLAFAGQPSGSLRLQIPTPAARLISADFLGMEDAELSECEVGEVICELANMICGSVLSKVESSVTFRLESPRLVELETPAGMADDRRVAVSHGAVSVYLTTEQSECS
jgi:CheY-specific phosphatase CheX